MSKLDFQRETTPFSQDEGVFTRTSLDIRKILSGDFWAELRVFLAVAKSKSYSKSSELIGVNQKTVVRHVKRLQDVLGVALVIPTSRGVKFTAPGLELARKLSELDYTLFKITEDLKAQESAVEARVRIGVTDGLGALFIAPSIPFFRKENQQIAFELKSIIHASDIRANNVDIMISSLPLHGDDIVSTQAGYLHFIPMVSSYYTDQYGIPSQSNLGDHIFIHSEFFETDFWMEWKALIAQGRSIFLSDSSISYSTMVKAGVGIGLLGNYLAVDTRMIPLNLDVHIKAPLFVVSLADSLAKRHVRATAKWLIDLFSQKNPWFSNELILETASNDYDRGLRRMLNV